MAMASAYFDDSGTHPESNTAIAACYFSTVKKWRRFDAEWRAVADREGFQTFHMSECAAKQGEFVQWPEVKRKRVVHRLCTIINKYVIAGTVVGVLKRDYDRLIQGEFRDYCGRFHYTFAVRHCAWGVKEWATANPSSSIEYFFDQMSKGKGEIMAVLDRKNTISDIPIMRGYSFADKAIYRPLQASDILAWSYFQLSQRRVAGRPLNALAQQALDTLLPTGLVRHKFYDGPALINWAEKEADAYAALSRRTSS